MLRKWVSVRYATSTVLSRMSLAGVGLRSPRAKGGFFDPFLNCGFVQFGPQGTGGLISPGLKHVGDALDTLHEYVHFYQFTTTTFGLYYRMVQLTEYLSFCRIMRLAGQSGGVVNVPLVKRRPHLKLDRHAPRDEVYKLYMDQHRGLFDAQQKHRASLREPIEIELARLSNLDTYRLALCGYGELRGTAGTEEAPHLINEAFHDIPAMIPTWPASRYEWAFDFGLADLLECHALVMSINWMRASCRALGARRSVIRAADRIGSQQLKEAGPVYTRLFRSSLRVATESKFLTAVAAAVDLALNPSLFGQPDRDHGPTVRMHGGPVLHFRTDIDFEPLTRYMLLSSGLQLQSAEYRLGVLAGDRSEWASAIVDLADEYLGGVEGADVSKAPAIPPFHNNHADIALLAARAAIRYALNEDVPLSVGLLFADTFGSIARALAARQVAPLLMGSGTYSEINWLISRIGGLNMVASQERRVYVRQAAGLGFAVTDQDMDALLRLLTKTPNPHVADPTSYLTAKGVDGFLSDWVVRDAVPHLHVFEMLMNNAVNDIAGSLDQPAFGFAGPTARDVLAWHRVRIS